nr:hypothetical protein [uncultured Caproiciproducens sp.]
MKKQLAAKLTDDEKTAAEQQAIQDQLAAIQKENSQFKFEKQFLSGGYDAKTAVELAEAMAGGDMKKFTEAHAKYAAEHEKQLQADIKAKLLQDTPGLQSANKVDPNATEPSLGEKAAQSYNQQFAPAPAATQTQTN